MQDLLKKYKTTTYSEKKSANYEIKAKTSGKEKSWKLWVLTLKNREMTLSYYGNFATDWKINVKNHTMYKLNNNNKQHWEELQEC